MATRERLIEQPLPAMEGQMKMPFPAMELSNRGWFKVFGVVTNRTLAGDEVIWWSRQRCGKGEEVHSVLKSDLAGGRLPVEAVRSQRCMVGHSGAGVQLELCDEASGVGWTVGEQTTQGSALRADSPSGTGDAAHQEADHPAVAGPSLIRVVAQGSAEHIGAGCRAVPSIGGPCPEHRMKATQPSRPGRAMLSSA